MSDEEILQEHTEKLSIIQNDIELIRQLIQTKVIDDLAEMKKEVWGDPSMSSEIHALNIEVQRMSKELFVNGGLTLAGKVEVQGKEQKILRYLIYKIFGILCGLGTIGGGLMAFLK